jgi:hypothetical protein
MDQKVVKWRSRYSQASTPMERALAIVDLLAYWSMLSSRKARMHVILLDRDLQ